MSRLAVYTDTDDLDPSAGIELLKLAGFEVVRLETHDVRVKLRPLLNYSLRHPNEFAGVDVLCLRVDCHVVFS